MSLSRNDSRVLAMVVLYQVELFSKRNISYDLETLISNNTLSIDDFRKSKDSASAYGKRVYQDSKFALISANIPSIINYISSLDISLLNIFQSTYKDITLVQFLDNAFADKGNFFRDFYCSILSKPEELPIVITNIRLALQSHVGNISNNDIEEFLSYGGEL